MHAVRRQAHRVAASNGGDGAVNYNPFARTRSRDVLSALDEISDIDGKGASSLSGDGVVKYHPFVRRKNELFRAMEIGLISPAPEDREVAITPTSHDALIRVRSSDREHALSMGRSYSPSAASSIETRFAPSLRSLEVDYITSWEEQGARGRDSGVPLSLNGPIKYRSEKWTVPASLEAAQQDEHKWVATLALNPDCEHNLISTRTVEREALVVERIESKYVTDTITGQPVYCVGYVNMRVFCEVQVRSLRDREPDFKQSNDDVRFLVVESNHFDVIIGQRTMEDEGIHIGTRILLFPSAEISGNW